MRLHEIERTPDQWVDFLVAVRNLGITTLHSSSEYESFPLFREVLLRLKRDRPDIVFRHMVKLGEPHFGEGNLNAARLASRVDAYRDALAVDCVDDIQWMWRDGLQEDRARIERFKDSAGELRAARDALRSEGKIERLLCFPYTPGFAGAALMEPSIDGLVVYRNIQETEYDAVIAEAGEVGKSCIVIRPFNGGNAFGSDLDEPSSLLAFALDSPAIEAAVLSSSSIDHLSDLVETRA